MLQPMIVSASDDDGDATARARPSPPLAKKPRRTTARRLAQCRTNQARYRTKQNAYAVALESTVVELRETISGLVERREQLTRQLQWRETARQGIIRLYDVMRHGLTHDEHRPRQLALLTTLFHHDVRMDGERGCAAVVEQWRRFSDFWGDLTVALEHLDRVVTDQDTVTMRQGLRLELTVTAATIRHVFPHLMEPQNHDLLSKLIDQRLLCDATAIHDVNTDGQILEVEWSVDFIHALRSFFSLRDVARVLDEARITRDAYLRAPEGACWLERPMYHHRFEHGGLAY